VFLVNSRSSHFTATTLLWRPLSRSYGANLPSSFTIVLSNTLVSSTYLPVSVCGTVERIVPVWLFSAPSSSATFHPEGIHSADQQPMRRQKKRPQQFNLYARFRNINLTSIDYAYGLALGPTDPSQTNCTTETLGFRWTGFSPVFSLLIPAFSLVCNPRLAYTAASPRTQRSSTIRLRVSQTSVDGLSPHTLSAQNHIRPVRCYAVFKGWLLLSQPPGCLRDFTSFYT